MSVTHATAKRLVEITIYNYLYIMTNTMYRFCSLAGCIRFLCHSSPPRLLRWYRRVRVFSPVELFQHLDGDVRSDALDAAQRRPSVRRRVRVHAQHRAAAAEPVVAAAVDDERDAELTERGGAHHARLHRHVDGGGAQDGVRVPPLRPTPLKHLVDGHQLSVPRRVLRFRDAVAAVGDDGTVVDEDAADRDLAAGQRRPRGEQRHAHPFDVLLFVDAVRRLRDTRDTRIRHLRTNNN